jgi:hypothetical protein
MHYRYFFKVGEEDSSLATFTDYKLPNNDELPDFMEENRDDLIGHTDVLYDIRGGDLVNIDNIDYMFLCGRKYYRKEEKSTKVTLICEVCLMQDTRNLEHLITYNQENELKDA